jgi:hypothetical protein
MSLPLGHSGPRNSRSTSIVTTDSSARQLHDPEQHQDDDEKDQQLWQSDRKTESSIPFMTVPAPLEVVG